MTLILQFLNYGDPYIATKKDESNMVIKRVLMAIAIFKLRGSLYIATKKDESNMV